MIGETVGSYKILSKLSVGGMGTVYRAEHALIGKLAAVKVLHAELSSNRDIVNRFFIEAKATTSIKHPGIVEIFDYNYTASGHAYITMEFLEGMSLARRLKTGGRMGEGEAAMLLRNVCSALSAAHAKGIVHRDLKPDNIYLVIDAEAPLGFRPKVLDFGIAKLTEIGLAGTATKTGAVMGTPTYMSPEQCKGTGDVDHRADLYSLGCIYYELLTGRPPFTKLGAGELIGAHIYADPEKPSVHHPVGKESEDLIMSLLQKRPDKRPQSAKELAQRLLQLAHGHGWITAMSPEGVTGQTLGNVNPKPTPTAVTLDERLLPTEAPEPSTAGLTTPFGAWVEPSQVPEVVEKPTTLSGAASQSLIETKRSKKGLAIAMASAALLAGGAVAFVKLNGSGGSEREVRTATPPQVEPLPTPQPMGKADPIAPIESAPITKHNPAEPTVEPKTEPTVEPKTEPTIEPKVAPAIVKKPVVIKRPVIKRPPVVEKKPPVVEKKPPVVEPKPDPKPDPKKCDQPPCIEREGP